MSYRTGTYKPCGSFTYRHLFQSYLKLLAFTIALLAVSGWLSSLQVRLTNRILFNQLVGSLAFSNAQLS